MVTTFHLIRHATHELVGRTLTGRKEGISLSEVGRRESERLAQILGKSGIAGIYSSPLQRATETAEPLAACLRLPVEVASALDEFDFGTWAGRELALLQADPVWKSFNEFRSGTRAPGGESMLDVQVRAVACLERLHRRYPDGAVAVVSHADVLRAAVLHYLGMPLDFFLRIELAPASITVVELAPWGARILRLNDTCASETS